MLQVVTITVLLVTGFAQDCSSPAGTRESFGQYLQCIKEGLDQNYEIYENEIREHGRRAALACFSSSIDEGNKNDRCVLNANDLNQVAWDRHGPLRDCTICRTR
uniref:Secreted protein n=1 Tax=Heterorhabditis bacteriophora TaxID=37862 RepID=A0A1I7XLW9_HETBA